MDRAAINRFFGTELLAWYKRERRDLPWRRSRDPYRIWVSEIMLQQTRVETVIPYYHRFMERFPTIGDLAAAPEPDVLKAWEGLGYYSRARNLQAAARQVVELHGGTVPRDKASVSALKGVGPYTAGAILSIAFDQPEPAVDGNVMRVLSRFYNLDDDIARPSVRGAMEDLARELIPQGEAASFNQALMELGALVCTPRSPGCLSCPVMEHCAGRLAGRERELPVKTKAKPPKPVHRLAVLIEGEGPHAGRVLVRQRSGEGLLASMWELPHVEAPNESVWASAAAASDWLAGALAAEGLSVRPIRAVADAEHVFTHLHWFVKLWSAKLADAGGAGADADGAYRWIDRREFGELAWPNVFRKLLGAYFEAPEAYSLSR
ncbi:A/G-specific adenine glycosylase [Cohnella sp. CFH 77786]|uniref:A/G-specific adenine glycosylase n=1 Tax=Cohnella sp. CFH 77786 TaxID=2662265 RepID=UPI001C60CE9A|nr:A/G-specific adenine glycosylase [Cohnella sp. CFH 77786]MBW5445615.1 A/G-specific adenine glycosylase [Cohnella sp. CFH 77786]